MDNPTPVSPTPPITHQPQPATSGHGSGDRKESGPWRQLLATFGILASAALIAVLLISFVFRSYEVSGPSMQNTLHDRDKLIIWKLPRTWARITGHPYIPKRGDIVVFTESGLSEFYQTDTKQLIKRVIGLPGDRVTIKNDRYVIYNQQHPDGFDPDITLPYFNHGKNLPKTTGNVDVTLGSDQVFVSGDNRGNSLDSRNFGPINANQIIGQLIIRVVPISDAKSF
ncbi:MAG TPA: signal peptidase I [Candidatus Saccharimonadales bacterium]|nr:signal peptidase I [Candidatus Saccharimonadales bacterium]